jgi:hypothetical protein
MKTQGKTATMTRRDEIAGWLFGVALVIVLPSMIVMAHAVTGGS